MRNEIGHDPGQKGLQGSLENEATWRFFSIFRVPPRRNFAGSSVGSVREMDARFGRISVRFSDSTVRLLTENRTQYVRETTKLARSIRRRG